MSSTAAPAVSKQATQEAVAPPQQKLEKKPPRQKQYGQVKAVLSGDTLVISQQLVAQGTEEDSNKPKGDVTITLTGITAPRLSGANQKHDEPFAWDSREFLRKKCIGQVVMFLIHNTTSSSNERCFGSVWLAGEDLSRLVLSEGWANLRQSNLSEQQSQRPEIKALVDAEADAKKAQKGLHSKDAAARTHAIRPVEPAVSPLQFFDQNRGKEIHAVVEAVRTGSLIRVIFLPSFITAPLTLSGIVCPNVRWIAEKRALESEPFGLEARQFIESHVLNRDVSVILKGIDKSNGFVGIVSALGHDIAEELLKLGFASLISQSGGIREKDKYTERLISAQEHAMTSKLGIWSKPNLIPSSTSTTTATTSNVVAESDKVIGKVVDIQSAGIIVVEDDKSKKHKMFLASIRAPKPFRDETTNSTIQPTRRQLFDNMISLKAQEAMRNRIIGVNVNCFKRYERHPPSGSENTDVMQFFDVYHGVNGNNIAMPLVKDGLAEVIQHKGSEPRSVDYDELVIAEKRAQEKKKGMFASIDTAEIKRVSDITGNSEKSKEILPFLQRQGEGDSPFDAIIEHVFSTTRFKVYIPSQNVMISLCLQYIRPPQHQHSTKGESNTPQNEAGINFVKSLVHLRNVLCRVVSIDRRGNLIGDIKLTNGDDIAVIILKNGYARVEDEKRSSRIKPPHQLKEAENSARANKVGFWPIWTAEEEEEMKKQQEKKQEEKAKEIIEIVISDIPRETPQVFYFQNVADIKKLADMTSLLTALVESPEGKRLTRTPGAGEVVLAQFSDDELWYRAKITAVLNANEFTIQYLDFGTSEETDSSHLRLLPHGYESSVIQPIAKRAILSYLIVPDKESGLVGEYVDLFQALTDGKKLTASIESFNPSNNVYCLGLACDNLHVNIALVKEGLARVEKGYNTRNSTNKLVVALLEAEDKARKSRLNLWRYGDIDEDDDY